MYFEVCGQKFVEWWNSTSTWFRCTEQSALPSWLGVSYNKKKLPFYF